MGYPRFDPADNEHICAEIGVRQPECTSAICAEERRAEDEAAELAAIYWEGQNS
jgi:hypothetical protein